MWINKAKIAGTLLFFSSIFIICYAHSQDKSKDRMGYRKGRETSFRLASYYSEHMVLQRAPSGAVLWGYAEIGASIHISFAGANYSDVAIPGMFGPDVGVWKIVLNPQPAGGPNTITIMCTTIEGVSQIIQLGDVLFGDVWICSGQSNMQFPVRNVYNASNELKASSQFKEVRLLALGRYNSTKPLYDVNNIALPWSLPSNVTLAGPAWNYFSAVCWFYGRNLYEKYGIPIGLVETCWGGSLIEVWSPPDVIDKCNVTARKLMPNHDAENYDLIGLPHTPKPPTTPSVLWNAMIHPLLNMTIKGAIWYQGEANSGDPYSYKCLFPAMISSWRDKWHEGSAGQTEAMFPFGFVQLCTSNKPEIGTPDIFTGIRWAQTAWYGYAPNPVMPNVFMATAIDLPDLESTISPVHPRDKQDVGLRLSLAARAVAYKEKGVVYQGPFPTKLTVNNTEHTITVALSNTGSGKIKIVGHGPNYEVCCSFSTSCKTTDPWIAAPVKKLISSDTLLLSYNCLAAKPVALRYLWRDYPCTFKKCEVYTVENDLPALPFWLALK